MDRRTFLRSVAATAASVSLGQSFWRAHAGHVAPIFDGGPYGALGAPDARGLRLPAGFTSRLLARSGEAVPGTAHAWHFVPDGGATFATDDGGWIYVSNSEQDGRAGGVGAIRFDADGRITAAYTILANTTRNCAGGSTPWGTWLSCEEVEDGRVWECDPTGEHLGVPHYAMGMLKHEAAIVDPVTNFVYMTEDQSDGLFWRFRPDDPTVPELSTWPLPILESGTLEAMRVLDMNAARKGSGSAVEWIPAPLRHGVHPLGFEFMPPARRLIPDGTLFARGEGAWFDDVDRTAYFATTGDNRIWAYDTAAETIEVLFDGPSAPGSPLGSPDNLTVAPSGDLYVCEDGSNLEMVLITPEGRVAPFLQLSGSVHNGSELTGVAFDPSGTRMYFSSQRAQGVGATYEITGPFRAGRLAG